MSYEIDVYQYLESRLPGHFEEDDRGWLIGSCLWHDDGKRPNLGVYAETGYYRCLSCGARGDLIKLIQKVEGFGSYDEAEAWLMDHFGSESMEDITFEFPLKSAPIKIETWTPPSEDVFELYRHRHPYMFEKRGITEEIQEQFEVGYYKGAVTIPWRDRVGKLITVKFRTIYDKNFWYSPRVPKGKKGSLLYGLHEIVKQKKKEVWITEAEIDALSLWQSGRPGIALGCSLMSKEQAYELALSSVERVVMICDRDEAGKKAHVSIRKELRKYGITVAEAIWPHNAVITDSDGKERPVKDVNELLLIGRIDELTFESTGSFLSFSITN